MDGPRAGVLLHSARAHNPVKESLEPPYSIVRGIDLDLVRDLRWAPEPATRRAVRVGVGDRRARGLPLSLRGLVFVVSVARRSPIFLWTQSQCISMDLLPLNHPFHAISFAVAIAAHLQCSPRRG